MAASSEDVTVVVRPLKIISFVCGCLSLILLIMCVASEYWLQADRFRQGLWKYCHKPEIEADWNCENVEKAWIKASSALSVISLILVLIGAVMTGIGLFLKEVKLRFTLFMGSIIAYLITVVCMVVALIVFPAMFMTEIEEYQQKYEFEKWYFAWSYGVAWGGAIFAFGGAMLMFVDRNNDDILQKTYY